MSSACRLSAGSLVASSRSAGLLPSSSAVSEMYDVLLAWHELAADSASAFLQTHPGSVQLQYSLFIAKESKIPSVCENGPRSPDRVRNTDRRHLLDRQGDK